LDKENVSAGVVVAVATDVVKRGDKVPALKLVTVPVPHAVPITLVAAPLAAKHWFAVGAVADSDIAVAPKCNPTTDEASVPDVVTSPDKLPLVIVVAPENCVRFPEAGVPVVDTFPPPPGVEQLAFPPAVIPVENCPPVHWVGVPDKAVAVAAFPVVLWLRVGTSPTWIVPQLGAADTAPVPSWVRNCFVEVVFPASLVQAGVTFA